MRIGVYPGTFDPIHVGHTFAAQLAAEAADLEKIIMVPAWCNPHKTNNPPEASFMHRLGMVAWSLERLRPAPYWETDAWELSQERPIHTWELLQHLQKTHPSDRLFLIIGGDSLLSFHKWDRYEWILENFDVVVVNRDEVTRDNVPDSVMYHSHLQLVTGNDLHISSTTIRDRIKHWAPVTNLVTREVEAYIQEHNVYREGYVNADYQS